MGNNEDLYGLNDDDVTPGNIDGVVPDDREDSNSLYNHKSTIDIGDAISVNSIGNENAVMNVMDSNSNDSDSDNNVMYSKASKTTTKAKTKSEATNLNSDEQPTVPNEVNRLCDQCGNSAN